MAANVPDLFVVCDGVIFDGLFLFIHSYVIEHQQLSVFHGFNCCHGFVAVNIIGPLDRPSKQSWP